MVESLPSYCSTTDLFSGKRTLRTICELILAIKTTNGLSKNIARNSSNLSQNFANDSDFEVVRKVFVAHWLSIFFVDVYQNSTIDFRNAFFALMIRVGEVFFSYISCSAFDFHCLTSVVVVATSDFQWEDEVDDDCGLHYRLLWSGH